MTLAPLSIVFSIRVNPLLASGNSESDTYLDYLYQEEVITRRGIQNADKGQRDMANYLESPPAPFWRISLP